MKGVPISRKPWHVKGALSVACHTSKYRWISSSKSEVEIGCSIKTTTCTSRPHLIRLAAKCKKKSVNRIYFERQDDEMSVRSC